MAEVLMTDVEKVYADGTRAVTAYPSFLYQTSPSACSPATVVETIPSVAIVTSKAAFCHFERASRYQRGTSARAPAVAAIAM